MASEDWRLADTATPPPERPKFFRCAACEQISQAAGCGYRLEYYKYRVATRSVALIVAACLLRSRVFVSDWLGYYYWTVIAGDGEAGCKGIVHPSILWNNTAGTSRGKRKN